MNVLSWLGFISLLSETHHLYAVWTQFNLGLEISSFFSPLMKSILHKREAVLFIGCGGEITALLEMAFLPSADSESPTWTPESH